jgi:hypothetical protein
MPRSATARLPRPTKAGFRQQALDLLGIDEGALLMVTKITPLLEKAKVFEKVWGYLETSSDEMAKILIAQKYKLKNKSQRDAIPFEAYCLAAQLDPKKVMGMIFSEVFSQNQQAAELMAASAQPDVVQATIDRAIEPGGTREREMLHKHSRFVPVPQTSVTFVREAGKVIGGDDNSQTLSVLQPIEKRIKDLSDRFNEKMLGTSAPAIEVQFQESEDDEDVEE